MSERVWARSLATSDPSRWAEVESHMQASLKAIETGMALIEAARTHVAWGQLCRERQLPAEAVEHFDKALAQFETSALTVELQQVRRIEAQML